ncbi:SusC/RagA family TonB-linked outer membrane protein [Rufibacter glacialis]|nr:TonB-dependent receptor [Rufibacter glacialis]
MTNALLKNRLVPKGWLNPRQGKKASSFLLFLVAFLALSLGQASAQQRTITGTVTGDGAAPLIGVSVVLKGTSTATATDVNGQYSLPFTGTAGTLVFSYIGYVTQEVPVGTQSTINVNLLTDAKALEEVVVVGYGTQRREDVTGAVATVTEESFNRGLVTTPDQLITGKVAGVQITSNGGAPGSGSTIRIRGGSSLNASNDPLIVIDGVPLDNSAISGSPNPLSLINPNDIESFNILKDASAAAIYGTRASNGVIIITTKKGAAGEKFRVQFNTIASLYDLTDQVDVLSADEYRALINERGTDAQKALLGNTKTNWQDQIFRRAFASDNNLVLSGSVKNLPYRLSLGYLDQQGTLKTSGLERGTLALNLNPSFLDDHLRVNLNVKSSLSKSRFADEGAIGSAVIFDPTQPVYAENPKLGGYYEWVNSDGTPNNLAPKNPLSLLEQRRNVSDVMRSIGNLQVDYRFHFLPDLRANLNVGYDMSRSEGSTFAPMTMASVFNQGGSFSEYEQEKDNKLLDFYLNYSKDLTALRSRVELMAGYSYQNFLTKSPSFPVYTEAGVVFTPAALFPFETENTLIGFFGRINYTFNDRYSLTANIRRDGTSRYSADNRWGTFPSIALAWRISEEGFMKDSRLFSDLKLRVGYGLTGQQDFGSNYGYLPFYSYGQNTASYQFGNQFYTTLRPAGYDVDLKWEETKQYNAGLDFGFGAGRVTGSLDYYLKETNNLIAFINPAAGTNLTNGLFTNVGAIESKGVEAALNVNILNNEKANWSVGVNGTYNDVKVTSLSRFEDPNAVGQPGGQISGGTGNNLQISSVGFTPFAFYVYKQVYNAEGKPLEGVYVDLNKDGIVNERDLYRYKSPQAKVFLGFNSDLTYGNWNLNFVLRANIGNYVYNNIHSDKGNFQVTSNNTYLNNLSPNFLETNFNAPQYFSDYYVQNASFLRMENLNLGYNFGKVYRDKVNLRLSGVVQNVFVITKYKGLDPEVGSGIDNNFYPRARVFSLGANLEF